MPKKRREFRLPEEINRDAIGVAVHFANGDNLPQVESFYLEKGTYLRWPTREKLPEERRHLILRDVGEIDEKDQQELRRWLKQIVKTRNLSWNVQKEINQRMGDLEVDYAKFVFEDGRLQPRVTPKFDNLRGVYTYAVALLVSRDADGLARRLGYCVHRKCGRFFFNEREGAGRPKRFCCPEHKGSHDQWVFKNKGTVEYDRWLRSEDGSMYKRP